MTWHHDSQEREKWFRFMQSLSPEIDPGAMHLLDEMRFLSRALHQIGEQSLDKAGLSFAQYKVLMHLFFAEEAGDKSELNPSEISERQGISRNAVSSLIRNLEQEGLVERRLDPEDRRRFNISLTESGRMLVTEHARRHLNIVGSCFSSLSSDEQATLSRLLHKVRSHVNSVRLQF